MKKSRRHQKKLVAEINVVPYIDVMLVLLIIFMVTAPLLQQGVAVELPKAKANALDQEAKPPLIVSVNEKGEYFLNVTQDPQAPISAESLLLRVAAEHARAPQRTVLVKGDVNVPYGKVVQAMVMCQQAGVPKVGIVTQSFPESA